MYHVFLSGVEIGTTALESADPSMGVVGGKMVFHRVVSPFPLFLEHCLAHQITMNIADLDAQWIDTHVIPELRVFRADGIEIVGQGCSVMGMKDVDYEITIMFVPYPFYGEEFPHHCRKYEERFPG